jgi:hypothetical protein
LIFRAAADILPFFNFFNSLHPHIEFTHEVECDNSLPFLDIKVVRDNECYHTSHYRKPTDTGLYTTPVSYCDNKYKWSMIKGLIHRIWTLNSTFGQACKDVDLTCQILVKNGYKRSTVEHLAANTINTIHTKQRKPPDKQPCQFLVVPYSEGARKFTHRLKALNRDMTTQLRIVFATNKIGSYFSNKSPTPNECAPDAVYQFTCSGCKATYVGETSRFLRTRIL